MKVSPKYKHKRKTRTGEDNFGFRHIELEEFVRKTMRLAFAQI